MRHSFRSLLALNLILCACGDATDSTGNTNTGATLNDNNANANANTNTNTNTNNSNTSDGNTNTNDNTGNTNTNTNTNANTNQPQGVEINGGWIGGACETASDCSSSSFSAMAQCDTDFPNGMCTQSCSQSGSGSWICPDENTSPSTPFTTTRCVEDDLDAPKCTAECDFTKSPTGCRPGFDCVLKQRYGSAPGSDVYPVCMPSQNEVWPGDSALVNDIGGECFVSGDCANNACLKLSGGYCTKYICELTGCPSGTTCFPITEDGLTACLKDCSTDSACRQDVGQECVDGANACFPNTEPPAHDPSVGAPDCAEAWAEGLHPCDNDGDYIVVNKGARNLALCNSGSVVSNYQTALGFSPIGDKEQEGDGKTPEGVFYVSQLLPNSEFYKAFLISYPNEEDAARGIADGLITASQKNTINSAISNCQTPPQNTQLGSLIEIHGENQPGGPDWTWGCASVTNGNMDSLWTVIGVNDTIIVKP